MRFALIGVSLLSLLVVVAILLSLQSAQLPAVRAGMDAQDQVSRIAGVDRQSGMKVTESAELDGVMNGSRLRGVKVVSIVPQGQMQDFYGLIPGDMITGIAGKGDLSIFGDDPQLAASLVFNACQDSQILEVTRPGVGAIQLPRDRNLLPTTPAGAQPGQPLAAPSAMTPPTAAPAPSAPPAGSPAQANPPAPKDDRSSLQKQLDIVRQPR